MRIGMRTKERLELARAKENLWRKYQERDKGEGGDADEELEDAWMMVGEGILLLEEKGDWIDPEKEIGKMVVEMRKSRIKLNKPINNEMVDMGDKTKVISKEDSFVEEGILGVNSQKPTSDVSENTTSQNRQDAGEEGGGGSSSSSCSRGPRWGSSGRSWGRSRWSGWYAQARAKDYEKAAQRYI